MLFMQNADKARYGKKYDKIDGGCELDRDEFPTTLAQAFNILVMQDHHVIESHQRVRQYDSRRGLAFFQGGGRTGGGKRSNRRGFGMQMGVRVSVLKERNQ